MIEYEMSWLNCDGHYTLLLSMIITGVILIITIAIFLLNHFKWDIKYFFAIRAKLKQRPGSNQVQPVIPDELMMLLPPDRGRYDAFVSYNEADEDWVSNRLQPEVS